MADTKELRGDVDADLVRAMDALALIEDLTRHAWMVKKLEKIVRDELHKASLLHSMLASNPLFPERRGIRADSRPDRREGKAE